MQPATARQIVKLDLENWVLPANRLSPTPSQLDGMDARTEEDLRILGCDLIQNAGILLRLRQKAMAVAQMLFQRLYYTNGYSFQNNKMDISAMAALFLATKIEECPRKVREVIHVFTYILACKRNVKVKFFTGCDYERIKASVIHAETRLLKNLGFCVRSKNPHKILITYLQAMISGLDKNHEIWSEEDNDRLLKYAWNYLNDSLRTSVFVKYSSEIISCACLHLAALIMKRPFPESSDNQPWFGLFDVSREDVTAVCNSILRLYIRKPPKIDMFLVHFGTLGLKEEVVSN